MDLFGLLIFSLENIILIAIIVAVLVYLFKPFRSDKFHHDDIDYEIEQTENQLRNIRQQLESGQITPEQARLQTEQLEGRILALKNEEEVIEKYLVYADVAEDEATIKNSVRMTLTNPNSKRYALMLLDLQKQRKLKEVENLASSLRKEALEILAKLKLKPTKFASSITWATWDIAKQYYFFKNPQAADPKYTIGNPLVSKDKQKEIVNRHVGWEAYGILHADPSVIDKLTTNRKMNLAILDYASRTPKTNGTLSSKELAELGSFLREVAGY